MRNLDEAKGRALPRFGAVGVGALALSLFGLAWGAPRPAALGLVLGLAYGWGLSLVFVWMFRGRRYLRWIIFLKTFLLFGILFFLSGWGIVALLAFPVGFGLAVVDRILRAKKSLGKAR